eukprot:gene528-45013_t
MRRCPSFRIAHISVQGTGFLMMLMTVMHILSMPESM